MHSHKNEASVFFFMENDYCFITSNRGESTYATDTDCVEVSRRPLSFGNSMELILIKMHNKNVLLSNFHKINPNKDPWI